MFALRPGHLLHPYPAARTRHSSRRIDQKHLHPPKRDELEAPGRQPIVPRAALPTARAHRPAIGPRMQFHFQSRGGGALHPANRTIHERFDFLDTIEDSLELHPVPLPLGVDGLCTLPSSQRSERDAPLDRTARPPLLFYHHTPCRAGDLRATGRLSTDPQLGLWALWVTGMLSTSPQAPIPSQARNHPQIVLKSQISHGYRNGVHERMGILNRHPDDLMSRRVRTGAHQAGPPAEIAIR